MNGSNLPLIELFGLGVSVGLSMLCSAIETGITNLNPFRIRGQAEEGDLRAEALGRLIERREEVITFCLIGNNVALVSAAALGTHLSVSRWGAAGAAYATIGITILLLILGEILPKTYALTRGESLLLTFSSLLYLSLMVFHPVTRIPLLLRNTLGQRLGMKKARPSIVTRQDLETMLAKEHVSLPTEDMQVLTRLFNFERVTVREVMIPLTNVAMVQAKAPAREAIQIMKQTGHSRLPVYEAEPSDITGIIHYLDLLFQEALDRPVKSFKRPITFVPDMNRIDSMLLQFQKGHIETTIVVNEYGAPVGLVTLEDVLEEIVGEIHDEYDKRRSSLKPMGEGRFVLSGDYEIDALNESFHLGLPKEGFETVAGLAFAQLQKIPTEGEMFEVSGVRFKVKEVRKRRVLSMEMELGRKERGEM